MPTEPKHDIQKDLKGWRMAPAPNRPAYQDGDGKIRVPLQLTKNGRHRADPERVLLLSEAALPADHLTNAMTTLDQR
ncbi:hypothetical protein ACPEIF_14455 [Streptomyces sp. NPDC012600]|uniref:hypothetical protein n=1 Tax=Streptomyces sp. NPDC012600 TaxID=3415005 RepID=UPI002888C716|nr:hypothetical protein [Streptomyces sp. DSM 41633]